MAEANMIVKLLMQDGDFAKKLNKNKKEVSGFSSSAQKGFNGVVGVVGKLAPALGIAMGGMEAFNRLMASSQTLADTWGGVMHAAKTSVDSFFYAIGSGDFSAFSDGLSGLISRAREAYAALDDLGNVAMSYNYTSARDAAKMQQLINQARDESLTKEERQKAAADARALQQEMLANAMEFRRTSQNAILQGIAASAGVDASLFTVEMLDKAVSLDINANRDVLRQSIAADYAAYQAAMKEQYKYQKKEKQVDSAGNIYYSYVDTPESLARKAALEKFYAETILMHTLLEKYEDKTLDGVGQTLLKTEQAVRTAEGYMMTIQRVEKAANKVDATPPAVTAAAPTTTKSIVPRDVDAGSITTEWGTAFADVDVYRKRKAEEEKQRRKDLGIPETIAEIPTTLKPLEDNSGDIGKQIESITGLGSAFEQLGSAIGGSEGALLSWIGTAAQAAASIATTIAQLSAESAAYNADATAATTAAGAKAMSAHAGIPFAGVALGVAAVATIIATLASMPKFATGGIVTGPTVGLIGEAGPEAIIPLSKLDKMLAQNNAREVRVVGTLRARGKDLVGTISNYDNIQNVKNG